VAVIKDGFTDDPINALINGEPSVLLTVYKTKEEDALVISEAVQQFILQKQMQLPAGAEIEILYDNTDMLRSRINMLSKNLIIGLMIVFLLLWCFLNARLSFWGGMGIPVCIAGAMAILWAIGGTINMVSLFGLIMVCGPCLYASVEQGALLALYFALYCREYPSLNHRVDQGRHPEV
jgi:multidrug efflux pump subunit AcrB